MLENCWGYYDGNGALITVETDGSITWHQRTPTAARRVQQLLAIESDYPCLGPAREKILSECEDMLATRH